MAKQRDYVGKVFDTFSAQMEGFNRTEDEFRKLMSDREYQKKVFTTLSTQMDGFSRTEDEFYNLVSPKKKELTQPTLESTSKETSSGGVKSSKDKPISKAYATALSTGLSNASKRVANVSLPKSEIKPIRDISKSDISIEKAQSLQSKTTKPPSNKEEKGNVVDVVVESLVSGVTQMASGAAGLAGGVADLLIDKNPKDNTPAPFLSNKWFYDLISQKGEVENPNALSTQGIRDSFMKLSNNLAFISQKEAEVAKADIGVSDPTKQSIDHVLEGNYKDAVKSVFVDVIQQIPNLATMALSGGTSGAITIGSTSVGSSLQSQYQKDQDISGVDMAQALSSGIIEAVSEKLFDMDIKGLTKIGGALGDYLGDRGKALAAKIASEGSEKVKEELIRTMGDVVKETLKGAGQEVVEENIVAVSNFLIDAIDEDKFNKEEFDKLLKDMGQATLVSTASGGTISGLGAKVSQVPFTKTEKALIQKMEGIINNPDVSKEAKVIAQKNIEKISKGKDEESIKNFEQISNLETNEVAKVMMKQKQIERLENDKSLSKDVEISDAIDERIVEIKSEIGEIIKTGNKKEQAPIEEAGAAKLSGADPEVAETATTEADVAENNAKSTTKDISTQLQSKESLTEAISDAKVFQEESVSLLSTPEEGDFATHKSLGVIEVLEISEDGAKSKVLFKGKERTVDSSDLKLSDSQMAEKYASNRNLEFNKSLEQIIEKDVYDEDINKQRSTITPVETSPFRKLFRMNFVPESIKRGYEKVFTAGNIAFVRASELADAISGEKNDTLAFVSKKLRASLKKNPELRGNANTVLSKAGIDDKLDLLRTTSKERAMATLSGVEESDILLAMELPEDQESIETTKLVYDAIAAQTENGSKAEINALINDAANNKENASKVRILGAEWLNHNPSNPRTIIGDDGSVSERTIDDIENDIRELPNGEYILSTLKESQNETALATEALMKTKEGAELLDTINSARELIDSYSDWVQNNIAAIGIKNKDLGESILNNVGFYMKKTYEYWRDKKYTIEDAHSAEAIRSVTQSLLPNKLLALSQTKGYQNASEVKRAKMVKNIVSKLEKSVEEKFAEYISDITKTREYKPQNVNPNIVKVNSKNSWERELINEQFGRVLGKDEDAISRLHATVTSQTQIQSAAQIANTLNALAGEVMFDSKDTAIKSMIDSGMTPTEAGIEIGKNYVEIKDPLSPLDGKLIPKEIHDQMFLEGIKINDILMDIIRGATVLWRLAKTVYNPAGHFNNASGGHISIFEQGHFVDNNTVKFFLDRFRVMSGTNKISDLAKETKKIMIDNGLWNTSVSIGQLNVILESYQEGKKGVMNIPYNRVVELKRFFDEKAGGIKRYYAATDDFTKLILFHKEKDVFARKLYGKEYGELTPKELSKVHAETAERVKQNTPTMSRLPIVSKLILKSVAIGDFQGFRFGAFSSALNTFANSISDISKGMTDESLSNKQKYAYLSSGFRSLSAQTAVAFFNYSAGALMIGLAAKAMGKLSDDVFDEEEDEEGNNIGTKFEMYKKLPNQIFMPEWSIGQNLIPVGDNGKGEIEFMNLSNTIPNDEVYGLILGRKNMSHLDVAANIGAETFNINAVTNIAIQAMKGLDTNGKPITLSDGDVKQKVFDYATYLSSQYMIPTLKHMNKMATDYSKGTQGEAPEDWRVKDERKVEFGSYMKGLASNAPQVLKRTYKVKVQDQLFWNMKNEFNSIDKIDNISKSKGSIQNRIEVLQKYRNAYKVLDLYGKHNKINGFAETTFVKAFKGAKGISNIEKTYILTGDLSELNALIEKAE